MATLYRNAYFNTVASLSQNCCTYSGTDEDDLQIDKNETRLNVKLTKKQSVRIVHEHFEANFTFKIGRYCRF